LIVSISLLQRSLAVAIPRHSIRPVSDAREWTQPHHATTV